MSSGKTSRVYKGYRLAKRYKLGVSIIKPVMDTRYPENIVRTHNGKIVREDVYLFGKDSFPKANKARMVMIDEAQFFSIDEIKSIVKKCEAADTSFCTFFGLDRDYAGVLFPSSEYLLSYAHLKESLSAECAVCGAEAHLTQRLFNGFPAPVGERILIGTLANYEARCYSCYTHPRDVEEFFT